jgi:hypothetical protein
MLQRGERGLSAALLKVGQRCIENQQRRNDRCLDVLVEYRLKNDRQFKQPGNWRPKFAEQNP